MTHPCSAKHDNPSLSISHLREIGKQAQIQRVEPIKTSNAQSSVRLPLASESRYLPGFALSFAIALFALFINEYVGAPAALIVLTMGLGLNFAFSFDKNGAIIKQLDPGFGLATKTILRIGIALLGFQLTFAQVLDLGAIPIILSIFIVGVTLLLGYSLGRRLGLSPDFAMIATGATAICGASAALAISSSFPKSNERDSQTVIAIMIVTLLSSLAMVGYPLLAQLSGFDTNQAGLLFGATIHDVAQVIGAGLIFGGGSVEIAAYSKMLRVAMLAPVVIIIAAIAQSYSFGGQDKPECEGIVCTLTNLMPPHFISIFAAIVVLNSLVPLPDALIHVTFMVSKLALLMGLCALALKLNFSQLRSIGIAPVLLIVFNTCFVLTVAYATITVAF